MAQSASFRRSFSAAAIDAAMKKGSVEEVSKPIF